MLKQLVSFFSCVYPFTQFTSARYAYWNHKWWPSLSGIFHCTLLLSWHRYPLYSMQLICSCHTFGDSILILITLQFPFSWHSLIYWEPFSWLSRTSLSNLSVIHLSPLYESLHLQGLFFLLNIHPPHYTKIDSLSLLLLSLPLLPSWPKRMQIMMILIRANFTQRFHEIHLYLCYANCQSFEILFIFNFPLSTFHGISSIYLYFPQSLLL